MTAKIIGGIAFGEGVLILLVTLSIVIMAKRARGPYAGYAFLYALMYSPIGLASGGTLGTFGWYTMMGVAWAQLALEITLWVISGVALIFVARSFRKHKALRKDAIRTTVLIAVPHLVQAVLLRLFG